MKLIHPRLIAASCVLAAIFMALWGCRTPVSVEGNLDAEPFLTHQASVTKNAGGEWFVIAARGQTSKPFLTIEHQGRTHLFVAHQQGERSSQILPLTRVDIDWFNRASRGTPRLRFYDEVDELDVETTLGLWEGGDRGAVRWIGPPPEITMRGVVVPVELEGLDRSLASQIMGAVEINASGIVERNATFPPHRGPYIIIPDGPVSESGPRAASVVDIPDDPRGLIGWTWDSIDGAKISNDAELKEMAGTKGLELLIAAMGDDLRVGFANDGGPSTQSGQSFRVAIAESGFVINGDVDDGGLRFIMRAIDSLYKDHPLSAAYYLDRAGVGDGWHVDGNSLATTLRHQDLVAAGGYMAWMRAAILEEVEGLGPEASLYLARAFAYEEAWDAVEVYANRAFQYFSKWPRPPSSIGMGSSRLLLAEAKLAQQDGRAAAGLFERARDDFARGNDIYRAALAERRRLLQLGAEDFSSVIEAFSNAGAHYEARRTHLLAAAAELEASELDRAGVRLERFAEYSSPPRKLLLFSWALEDLLARRQGHEIDMDRLVERGEKAEDQHAWEAAVTFALIAHKQRSMYNEMDLRRLGRTLVEGTLRSTFKVFDTEVDRALGVICADVVFSTTTDPAAGIVDRECQWRVHQFMANAAGVRLLLEGGYRFLQRAELTAAASLEEYIFAEIGEDSGWALPRARALLFRAALAEEGFTAERDQAVVEAIQAAFGELRQGLAPAETPKVLRDWGREFDLRGIDRLSIALFEASRQSAVEVNQNSDLFEATLALAEARYNAERWRELGEMESVESPLHAARIDLYRAHAEFLRDNRGTGRELLDKSISRAEEFGHFQQISVYHLAAKLALERGALDQSQEYADRAVATLENLPDSLQGREEDHVLSARIKAHIARLLAMNGEQGRAIDKAEEAVAIFEALPAGTAPHVLREVYETAADLSSSADRFTELVLRLDELNRNLPEDAPRNSRRDIVRTLSRLLIENGDHRNALRRVRSVVGDGLGLASNRRDHHCTVGTARLYAGDQELAKYHFDRCSRAETVATTRSRAKFLLSLHDGDATSGYRAGLAAHLRDQLPETAVGQRARLDWMMSIASATLDYDEDQREELGNLRQPTRDDGEPRSTEDIVQASVEFVEYLIQTGKYEEADRVLQSDSAIFFEPDAYAEDQWVVLRLTSMVHQLRPFDFFDYIDRAVAEAPPQSRQRQAMVYYLRAMAHLQLGQYFPAKRNIDKAREEVDLESDLHSKIDALESTLLSTRFGE